MARHGEKVVGRVSVYQQRYIQNHVLKLAISVLKDYRGMGIGKYLLKEAIREAKKKLKPKPKMIRLGVVPVNKVAISLYEKMGFKEIGRVPKQFRFKNKLHEEIIIIKEL